MEIAIGVATILLGVLAATLPSFYKVSKTYRGKTKLTKTGWTVAISVILLVILQVFQIVHGEVEKKNEKFKSLTEQSKRDSLTRDFIVKNNKSIVDPFADGLRKYGLKYDSAKREIEQLVKDSAKKVIIINGNRPEFSICNLEATFANDTLKTTLSFCATQATLFNLKAELYATVRETNNQLVSLGKIATIEIEKVTTDRPFDKKVVLWDKKPIDKVYFFLRCSYKDKLGKDENSDEIIYTNPAGQMGFLTSKETIWVRDFFSRNVIR